MKADTFEGVKLKNTGGWDEQGNGTNESGFTALPGGEYSEAGVFSQIGSCAHWWSTHQIMPTHAEGYYLISSHDSFMPSAPKVACG